MASFSYAGVVEGLESHTHLQRNNFNNNFSSNWKRSWTRCTVCSNQVSLDTVTCYDSNITICSCCQERGRNLSNLDYSVIPAQPYQPKHLQAMRVQCRFYESGCGRESTVVEIGRHESQCAFRDVKCNEPRYQVSPSHWDDCNGTVPLPQYQKHLTEMHSYPVHYGPTVSVSRCIEPTLEYHGGWNRWHPTNISYNNLGFLWHCYAVSPSAMTGGVIYTWLSILADQGCANRYLYKLEFVSPDNPNIRWSWELPVVQYHDFSTPSDYSAAIPIGNLRKMVGALRFEIKLTISSVIFEQSFVQHGSQPVNGNIPNRNLLPIAASLPPPPLPTPIPTYSSVTALMPGPRRSGRGRRYPMY